MTIEIVMPFTLVLMTIGSNCYAALSIEASKLLTIDLTCRRHFYTLLSFFQLFLNDDLPETHDVPYLFDCVQQKFDSLLSNESAHGDVHVS